MVMIILNDYKNTALSKNDMIVILEVIKVEVAVIRNAFLKNVQKFPSWEGIPIIGFLIALVVLVPVLQV